MNVILCDLSCVNVIVDDIFIYGSTIQEHNTRLSTVLKRAREVNLKLSLEKLKICRSEIDYVGHILTHEGLKPRAEHIQTITDIPTPTNELDVQ